MTSSAPVALVTGGAKRVGAAVAALLAGRGYAVALHYNLSGEEAHRVAKSLGPASHPFQADLARPEAPAQLIQAVIGHYGRLDVLVNSAANFFRTPLNQLSPAQWDEVFAVNLRAPFFLALSAASRMAQGGCIINMADLAAFETWPAYIPHGIAKAGVVQATRALAKQLAPQVRVNAIAPGVVLLPDDMSAEESARLQATTPLRRHGAPADIVRAVEYLLDANFVTGEVLFVDGGRNVRR